jgi:hypothetical protein
VAAELNVSSYEDAITTIKADLALMTKRKGEFTSNNKLKQIESLIYMLQVRLGYFYQLLPKMDSRRGIINLGGNFLQVLFGTATVADLNQLHQTLDELQAKNTDLAHSIAHQVSCNQN